MLFSRFYDLHEAVTNKKEGYGRIEVYHPQAPSGSPPQTIHISWTRQSVVLYNPVTWKSEELLRVSENLKPKKLLLLAQGLV